MNNRIMILGSLGEFVNLTKKARERGIYTIVCDGNADGPAKKYADKVYDVDVTDIEEIADICQKEAVDGILTAFSDLLLECMVKICDKAKLPCYLTAEQLPYYRDKRTMKHMFNRLGIRTPRFVSLDKDFCETQLEGLVFPAVAKPVDKYGSRGIVVVNSAKEIKEQFSEICRTSDLKEILIEEYNAGLEFNVMSWLCGGKLTILGIADREKTVIADSSIPISTRNVYPSRLYDGVEPEVRRILEKIAGFTGQTDGELSMQFFLDSDGHISVGEVAARFLGYEHELIEFAGGFSIEDLLINSVYDTSAMKMMLKRHDARMKGSAAVIYFQARSGVVGGIDKIENLSGIDKVISVEVFYKSGDKSALYARPYAARVCVCCNTRRETDTLSEEIIKEAAMYDVNGDDLLYKNKIPSYEDY